MTYITNKRNTNSRDFILRSVSFGKVSSDNTAILGTQFEGRRETEDFNLKQMFINSSDNLKPRVFRI